MKACLLFCVAILFMCCTATHKVNYKKDIVYEIFDSLENYFACKVGKDNQKPIGIIIDPYCTNCQMVFGDHNLFGIAIVYKSYNDTYVEAMFNKKGRYFRIGKELYPVYILWVDDAFVDPYDLKTRDSYSRGKPSEYKRPYPLLAAQHFICVDLSEKIFIDDSGRRRGKVK